uniref:Uncharacterized protein n=1 Tax=Arundo donax TaxID=35708 RepID=A0A0A9C189_ARUDO
MTMVSTLGDDKRTVCHLAITAARGKAEGEAWAPKGGEATSKMGRPYARAPDPVTRKSSGRVRMAAGGGGEHKMGEDRRAVPEGTAH